MALFASPTEEGIFYAAYFVWIASFFFERIVISGSGQGRSKVRSDRGSALLIYAGAFVSITVAYAFAGAGIDLLPGLFFYLGITMMVLGMVVREWAVATLRGYFSYLVRVREDHRVIEKGPYRVVRHPAYSGSMLTILGLGVALGSWAGVLTLLVLFSLAYWYRIRVEERTLLAELGDQYAQYMRRTKRLIPYVL
jgi:protein-S-isoprenylcysteine O-methyltransferase Ste14